LLQNISISSRFFITFYSSKYPEETYYGFMFLELRMISEGSCDIKDCNECWKFIST